MIVVLVFKNFASLLLAASLPAMSTFVLHRYKWICGFLEPWNFLQVTEGYGLSRGLLLSLSRLSIITGECTIALWIMNHMTVCWATLPCRNGINHYTVWNIKGCLPQRKRLKSRLKWWWCDVTCHEHAGEHSLFSDVRSSKFKNFVTSLNFPCKRSSQLWAYVFVCPSIMY